MFTVEDYGPDRDWGRELEGCDVIVHAAAMVHGRDSSGSGDEYRRINTDGTLNLARQAVECGVRRFVFISTAKVCGDNSRPGTPFDSKVGPQPVGPYAISKYEAEARLRELSGNEGLEIVIVRPPLVYGPGVRANFLELLKWVDRGIPLPFAGVRNSRSLLYLGNLVDFLAGCVEHPEAAGEIFMVSDGEPLSTEDLVRRLARHLDRPARLFGMPPAALGLMSRLPRGKAIRSRLFCSLEVDSEPARGRLGWAPPYTVEEGLAETVRWYRERHSRMRSRKSWPARPRG